MKKSSKVILGIVAFLIAYLFAVYVPIAQASKPEMGQKEAQSFLGELARAFENESTTNVMNFAHPDAKIVGTNLDATRKLLNRAFSYMKNPRFSVTNVVYKREDPETVNLSFNVSVSDENGGGTVEYQQRVGMVVKRRESEHLGGFLKTYDWKISQLDAPNIPTDVQGLLGN